MLARLLHGFRYQSQPEQCCGRGWLDLPRHRSFAHGEEVVIPEQESVPCFCGAPAVGWVYQVMGDGQTINGLAVCAAHQGGAERD